MRTVAIAAIIGLVVVALTVRRSHHVGAVASS
jgi:hypothetical protein